MHSTKTLVVTLEPERREVRIAEITRGLETRDALVAIGEKDTVVGRFKLEDVRSWWVETAPAVPMLNGLPEGLMTMETVDSTL